MELILREIYYKDGTKTPFLFIEKENYDNLIFNFELDNEGNFITNLNYGFIDNFNANNLINNIFDKYNTTYIDKKLWERVVEDSKKEFEKKGIVKSMYILEPPYITAIDTDFNDLENYKTKLIKKIDYKTINSIYVNMHKVLEYNIKFSNEEQYTYGLLEILFNCNFNFKIVKCENCGKPFVTITNKLKSCDRIFKHNITCHQYKNKIRKQHQYDDPIKSLIKHVRDKLKDNEDTLVKFSNELEEKKETLYNDKKAFILWLLNNYYFTENGRQKIIEKLNLSKYF